ncbi:hypothetical protein QAO71_17405 (plasmid) [Halopseudomonas sp. SMJS2]|uniref:hypothetical protein n=1 Tax=Halopseudomonas sp. SMJS2 TaxID=3041098 RepID=UPI002452CF71|nr:hypothetical protein [Halopseudomonas sp. SMJS2]WGK63546.1 hypothetical protein QAO71_17405 [Halopseudomonas sp. SMJS2]
MTTLPRVVIWTPAVIFWSVNEESRREMGQIFMWVVMHKLLLQAIGVMAVERFIAVRE